MDSGAKQKVWCQTKFRYSDEPVRRYKFRFFATKIISSLKVVNSDEFEFLTKAVILIWTQAPSKKFWCQTKFSYSDEPVCR